MKEFILQITSDEKSISFDAQNRGFDVFELIGLLETKKSDLIDQCNHQARFSRTFIQDGKEIKITKEEELK